MRLIWKINACIYYALMCCFITAGFILFNFSFKHSFLLLIYSLSVFFPISFACKAFCFFYGLQCKQTHPTNSTSGTTLSTDVECGKLLREEKGIRTQSSVHTV